MRHSVGTRETRYHDSMKDADAYRIAHEYLCRNIALERCEELPEGLYGVTESGDVLFTFRLFGRTCVGSSEYIAVSKETGTARYVGFHGE